MESERATHIENLRRQLDNHGLSEHGRDWVMKALYPPGPGDPAPVPDESYMPSVTVEYRTSMPLEAPSTLPDGETWDMAIVSLPGDNIAAIACRAPRATNFYMPGSSDLTILPHQSPGTGSTVGRTVVGASTATWQEVGNSFDPVRTLAFRTCAKSLTLHCTSSALDNGGTLMAAQLPAAWTPAQAAVVIADRGAVPPQSLTVLAPYSGCIPLSEDDMIRMAPGTVSWEAKEGVYLPLRLGPDGGVMCRRMAIAGRTSMEGSGASATIASYGANPSAVIEATVAASAFLDGTVVSNVSSGWISSARWPEAAYLASPFADDNGYDQTSTGIVLLRGLSKKASFTLTVRHVVQRIVGPTSVLAPVVRPPVAPDEKALRAYYAIAQSMAYAYPARYNALGAVLPLVASALRAAAPHVLPLAKAAAGALISRLAHPPAPQQRQHPPRALPPTQATQQKQRLPPFRPAKAKAKPKRKR